MIEKNGIIIYCYLSGAPLRQEPEASYNNETQASETKGIT
jgi:hypothetical protein